MKSRKKYLVGYIIFAIIFTLAFLIFTVAMGYTPNLNAKLPFHSTTDIQLNSFEAVYDIDPDGTALITEVWDTQFVEDNQFTIMSKVINLYSSGNKSTLSSSDIEFLSVREPSRDKNYEFEKPKSDSLRSPYSFTLVPQNKTVALEWKESFYKENRVFEIQYRIKNFVNLYNDTAEIYWKLIPDGNSMDIKKFKATVKLPESVASSTDVKFWGHGKPVTNVINSNVSRSGNEIIYVTDGVKNSTYVESRITLPRETFSNGKVFDKDNLTNILNEEQKWADDTNQSIMIARVIVIADVILAAILVIIAIFHFRKRFKIYNYFEPDFKGDYYHKPPSDLYPTSVHRLYNFYGMTKNNVELSTTLLSLANKGHFKIETDPAKPKNMLLRVTTNEFSEPINRIEQPLFNIITDAARGKSDGVVSMKDINRYVEKHQETSQSRLQSLDQAAKADFQSLNYDDGLSISAMNGAIAGGVGLIVLGVIGAFFLMGMFGVYFTPLVLILFGVAMLVFGSTYKRLNQVGQNEYAKWYGFGKYMSEFSLLSEREAPELIVWEKYMIYATAMGIAEKVMSQLKMVYPEINNPSMTTSADLYRTAMFLHFMGHGGTVSISSGMTSLRTAATPTSDGSGGGGGGGGFSGGGGGGGGGGSMGGR